MVICYFVSNANYATSRIAFRTITTTVIKIIKIRSVLIAMRVRIERLRIKWKFRMFSPPERTTLLLFGFRLQDRLFLWQQMCQTNFLRIIVIVNEQGSLFINIQRSFSKESKWDFWIAVLNYVSWQYQIEIVFFGRATVLF